MIRWTSGGVTDGNGGAKLLASRLGHKKREEETKNPTDPFSGMSPVT
jgi:hypothetical protein